MDQLLINFIGALVIAREFESTSLEIDDPAAIFASFPILIGAINEVFEPIKDLFPIVVLCLLTPS